MTNFKSFTIAMLMGVSASAAQAATITTAYDVSAATSEVAGLDVSLWVMNGLGSGLGTRFAIDAPGQMLLMDDGTASLSARAFAHTDASSGFDIDFFYDSEMSWTPEFKSEFGSVPHGNETYLDMEGGTLTGFGVLAGLDFTVSRMPANGPVSTQIGGGVLDEIGANSHNRNFGLANWFFIESIVRMDCAICAGNTHIPGLVGTRGDLNVDLTLTVAPVPVPGSLAMLLTALGAGAMLRRRSRNRVN